MNIPELADEEENARIEICWLAATSTESNFKRKYRRREIEGIDTELIGHAVETLLQEKNIQRKMLLILSSQLSAGVWKIMQYQSKYLLEETKEVYKNNIEPQKSKITPKTDPKRKSKRKETETRDELQGLSPKIEIIDLNDNVPDVETEFMDVNNIKDLHLIEDIPDIVTYRPTQEVDAGHFGPLTDVQLDMLLGESEQNQKEAASQENETGDFSNILQGIRETLPPARTPSKRNAPREEPLDTPSKRSRRRLQTSFNEDPSASFAVDRNDERNSQGEELGALSTVGRHDEKNDQNEDLGVSSIARRNEENRQDQDPDVPSAYHDNSDFTIEVLNEDYNRDKKKPKKKKNAYTNKLIPISIKNIDFKTVPKDERIPYGKSVYLYSDRLLKMPSWAWASANIYKKRSAILTAMFEAMTIKQPRPNTDTTNLEVQLRDRTGEQPFEVSDELLNYQSSTLGQNLIEEIGDSRSSVVPAEDAPGAPETYMEISGSQAGVVEIPADNIHVNTSSLPTVDLAKSTKNSMNRSSSSRSLRENIIDVDPNIQENQSSPRSPSEWTKVYLYETLQRLWANNRPIRFSHLAPKTTTSKQNRTLAFYSLLELADEAKIRLGQERSWGPLEIWLSNGQ